MPAAIANTARFLARLGIPWPDFHMEMSGPSFGWCVSQWWKRSDDLAKHQLASKINGVVGKTGKNIPATPNITHTHPKAARRIFLGFIRIGLASKHKVMLEQGAIPHSLVEIRS